MNYTFTNEDVELVEKFITIRDRGYYCDGAQLTAVYNRVLHKNVNVTSCGSCLRQRVNELADALAHFKRSLELDSKPVESISEVEPTTTKVEENKPVTKENKKVKK